MKNKNKKIDAKIYSSEGSGDGKCFNDLIFCALSECVRGEHKINQCTHTAVEGIITRCHWLPLSSAVICSQLITVNSSWLKPCCDVTFSYADNSKLSRPIIFKRLRFILANYSTNNIFDSLRNISMNFDVL